LPEKVINLRQRLDSWHRLEQIHVDVPAMRRVVEQARLASRTNVPALIHGEAGSGKEWLARAIHHAGPSAESPFIALDCRHLTAAALTGIFFGSTGIALRPGSTLYLAESSFVPRELQARLNDDYLVADGHGNSPRILAGCSADPASEILAGRLLEEFHCSLSPLTIVLPPLRQRLGDLTFLAYRMLERANAGRDVPVTGLSDEAWELLRGYSWPGNLNELYALLATACRRAKRNLLEAADFPWYLRAAAAATEGPLPLDSVLEQAERRLIQWAIATAKGNKSKSADLLQISRPRLLRRMEALGIKE
jgi:DNA-binding NtrC family response regulator